MYDLLTRTISQGLQAFLPIVVALTWFRRAGDRAAADGLKWGILAAVPATAAAAYGFGGSTRQALWEAALASAALPLALWFARRVGQGLGSPVRRRRGQGYRLALAAAAALLISRQAMEIAVTLAAVIPLRARDPLLAATGGAAMSLVVSILWMRIGGRLTDARLERATRLFAALFVAQVAMYVFHEFAEAGLLPWSDVLHAATEPYGPDGFYGRYVSAALFVLPLAAAAALRSRVHAAEWARAARPRLTVIAHRSALGLAVLLVAGIELMSVVSGERGAKRAGGRPALPAVRDVVALGASPHLLFRHTAVDPNYSRLSIAPLDARGAADRAAAALACDRVSYAAGRGICLTADRGVFTTYKAVFFDRALKATHVIKLGGSPSRTRVSSDGRVGAITVFAAGAPHGYEGSGFSTTTTIVDMATGDELGDLEQFTTWRDGARFKAADFNFWGVTFARDSNVFYATLRTGGTTYLVRGDLGLRKLTVLRDNVECPSLSPDNRLIGFKKRVGSGQAPWRLYVLDLATLTDRAIAAETQSIDDQIEWLDDAHVLYGAPRTGVAASRDVWVAPIDGSGPARIFLPDAESPIVVR
jgi:hypothetical protein